jgi:hypothetical protein
MARKPVNVSLGTFGEEQARRIAHLLTTKGEIAATVENLRVDSGPTTWWHVHVPAKSALMASMWLSGYLAGHGDGMCSMRADLQGSGTYITSDGTLQ